MSHLAPSPANWPPSRARDLSGGKKERKGEKKAKGAAQREEGRVSAHAGEGEVVGTQGMRSLVPLLSGMSTTDRPSERQLIFGASDVHESPGQSV